MGAKWGMVIYNCISAAEILLALVCISRVVYLEPGMSGRRNKILFAVAFLVPTLLCPGMSKDIFSAFPVCFFAVYMVIVRREKRIRGIFLTVPVLGFLMGIVSVFYAVPYTLTGKYPSEGGWLYAVDALFWIAVLIIYWKRDETVHLLRLDEPYRRLGKWERNFLHAGVFVCDRSDADGGHTDGHIRHCGQSDYRIWKPCVGVFGNVCGHFGMAGESERLLPVYDYDRRALSAG